MESGSLIIHDILRRGPTSPTLRQLRKFRLHCPTCLNKTHAKNGTRKWQENRETGKTRNVNLSILLAAKFMYATSRRRFCAAHVVYIFSITM